MHVGANHPETAVLRNSVKAFHNVAAVAFS